MRVEREMMRGAGALAVLRLLEQRDMYGYELAEALSARSDGVLALGHSSLYPMLYNLEAKKLIRPVWRESDGGRRRKYYGLTDAGRAWLRDQQSQWSRLVEAMAKLGVGPAAGDVEEAPAGGKR